MTARQALSEILGSSDYLRLRYIVAKIGIGEGDAPEKCMEAISGLVQKLKRAIRRVVQKLPKSERQEFKNLLQKEVWGVRNLLRASRP
ncbi:MAG: hypothetical protein ABIJ84_03350 [bacterium]